MKRGRYAIAAKPADPPFRRHEVKRRLWLEEMFDAYLSTKVSKIGATAHTDMLTCVDELPGGDVLERACPAA
jgi:hypothetical protein